MKIKRIIAAVMALVLVGGAYPFNTANTFNISKSYAADSTKEIVTSNGIKYSFRGDTAIVEGLADTKLKDIIIPAEVNGCPVTNIEYSAFRDTAIETVVLGENVDCIDIYAFENCSLLKEVTLNDKLRRIDSCAFKSCVSLAKVNGGSNLERIGDMAFENCLLLSEFEIGEKVTYLGDSVFARTSIKKLVIPEGVKKLYDCPAGMSPATTSTNYNANAEIIIKNHECELLINTVSKKSNWDKCLIVCDEESKAHEFAVKYNVRFCTPEQYENGDYEKFELSAIDELECLKKYGMTFAECEGGLEVAYIDKLVDDTLIIPDEVGGVPVVKYNLNPGEYKVSSPSIYFQIKKIVIGKNVKVIGDQAFAPCMNIVSIEGCEGLESIGSSAFFGLNKLESFPFGSKLKTIGTTAFCGCAGLKSLELPDSLETIGESAFAGCYSVESIKFGSGLKTIGKSAFADNRLVSTLEMPQSLESIGEKAFYECLVLTDLKLNEGLTDIGSSAFKYCVRLKNAKIPSTMTEIKDETFFGTNIDDLIIPENITKIGKQIHNFVSGNVILPGNVKVENVPATDKISITVYNPKCEIPSDGFTDFDVIYGYKGSTAEEFANNRNADKFKAIDEELTNKETVKFETSKTTYMIGEPITVVAENVDVLDCKFSTNNLKKTEVKPTSKDSGTIEFKGIESGKAWVTIT
ncbi:leucine-rich repeat domain-containing protein, partial [Ruminococcus flavefaciens]